MRPDFAVLYERDSLLAIDKPPGYEATGRTVDDPEGMQAHVGAALRRRVWLVHQLDRDTSGVLLFVTKRSLVAVMQEKLRHATKRYLAIVHGEVREGVRVDRPMAYDDRTRRWAVSPGGKPALTEVVPRAANDGFSIVEVRLHTGRTHQARVHLASIGHPLVGERRYRDPPCERAVRQALHAWRITLGELSIEAPVPEDLRALATELGLGGWPSPDG
ncbi:MAG: RluA family pseudouridine synthase [Sandaracinaceae bacterium]